MKRTVFSIFVIAVALALSLVAGAVTAEELPDYNADEISIFVDGTQLECPAAPFIDNGRTLVPMRAIFERLEAVVEWEGTTRTITATKGETVIIMQISNTVLTKDGVEETMDVAPVIVGGSTFVPLRAVSQALGTKVDWFGNMRTASITSPGKTPAVLYVIYNEAGVVKKATEEQFKAIMKEGWLISNFEKVTLYKDMEAQTVFDYDAFHMLSTGWTTEVPMVTMYAPDGRTIEVRFDKVEENKKVGWYTEPLVLMYAADGRTQYFEQSKVAAQKTVGWTTEPPMVTMYSIYGDTTKVMPSYVEAYKAKGWYTEPVVPLYSADGRVEYFEQSKVDAQLAVGWYREPFVDYVYDYDGTAYQVYKHEKAEYLAQGYLASKPSNNYSGSSGYNPSADGYYYRTPTGKRYHLDPNCGGKNSYQTSNIRGLSPCSKCAQ